LYPALPFSLRAQGITFSDKDISVKIKNSAINVTNLYQLIKGKHFLNVSISEASVNINDSSDNTTINFNIRPFLRAINLIDVDDSFFSYKNSLHIEVPINVAFYSFKRGEFNFLLNKVIISRNNLSEELSVNLSGGFKNNGLYLNEGGIKGKYVKLDIRKVFNKDHDKIINGYLDGNFLKLFSISADGNLKIEGYEKKQNYNVHYKTALTVNKVNLKSEGSFFAKRSKITLFTKELNINNKKLEIDSSLNYKKGEAHGSIALIDYDAFKRAPFKFSFNLRKKLFSIYNNFHYNEEYDFRIKGSFKDNKISFDQILLNSNSTKLTLKGTISKKSINGVITGEINNNRDIMDILKVGKHNINIKGSFDIDDARKKGYLNINLNRGSIYNLQSINLKLSGTKKFQCLMDVGFDEGYLKGRGEFSSFNSWKIDYILKDIFIRKEKEKDQNKTLRIGGFGIVEHNNRIYESGIVKIKGLLEKDVQLAHNFKDDKLSLFAKDLLNIYISQIYNAAEGHEYKVTIKGYMGIPFLGHGVIDINSEKLAYRFDSISIKNTQLFASGGVDLKRKHLEALLISKSAHYPIKLNLSSDLTFKEGEFKTIGKLVSKEQYNFICKLKKNNGSIYINTFNINSKSTSLAAFGDIKSDKFDVNMRGTITNNKDLLALIKINHSLNFISNIAMLDNNINYKFLVNYNKKLYTFNQISSFGNFDLKSKNLKHKTLALSQYGSIEALIIKKMGNPIQFNISTEKMSTELIEKIGGIKLKENGSVSASIEGEYSKKIKFQGNVKVKKLYLENAEVNFNFVEDTFSINSLKLENDVIKEPFVYSLKNKFLKIHIDEPYLKNRYIDARNIYINVDGPVHNPMIESHFILKNKTLGTINAFAHGDFDNLEMHAKSDNVTLDVNYMMKNKKEGSVKLKFAYGNLIEAELPLNIRGKTINGFDVHSKKITVILNKKNVISAEGLEFLLGKNGIENLKCTLKDDILEGVGLEHINIGMKGIYGNVIFNDAYLKYENIFKLHTQGQMTIRYNYTDIPQLDGVVTGKGLLNYGDFGIKLPIEQFVLNLKGHSVKLYALLYELESWLEVSYSTNNYLNYLDAALEIKGEHIYVNKLGFSGIFDISAQYNKVKRELEGNILIAKSHYTFEKVVTSAPSSKKNSNAFPLSLNLQVKTIEPVIVESEFANANVNIDLNVLYNKDLRLRGKINTTDTEVMVGREKFVINENYIVFRGKVAPYLYLEARGTGSYSYVVLKIYGTLPNYKIDIMNLDPNSTSYYETETGYNPQNLFTDVFAGLLFNNILKVTENVIGINKIGFEQRMEGGENVNYLKIGRQFSDRFEVKYVIGSQSQEEESEVMTVGEYILLDWFRFSLYSQNKGGSGVGFTFFHDF
jgi:hypothetical protein